MVNYPEALKWLSRTPPVEIQTQAKQWLSNPTGRPAFVDDEVAALFDNIDAAQNKAPGATLREATTRVAAGGCAVPLAEMRGDVGKAWNEAGRSYGQASRGKV